MPRAIRSLAATGIAGVLLAGPAVAPAAAATPQPPAHDRTTAAEARRVDRVPTPKLDWYACYDYAECATVRLPLDYDNPKGATTEVALLRVKARDQQRKVGSLFLNPGGPGGSGTSIALAAPYFLGDDLLDRFDIVGVDPRGVDIWMGTLSKTLVGCGGYIAGSSDLITYLKFQAPGMVYSVGLPATTSIGSMTALRIMRREPERVARLAENGQRFLEKARAAGLDTGDSWGYAVSPVVLGDSLRTVMLAGRLLERGINAFPIIPPGVPEKSARLRFFISASHTPEDIDTAVAAVTEEIARLDAEGVSVAKVADLMK